MHGLRSSPALGPNSLFTRPFSPRATCSETLMIPGRLYRHWKQGGHCGNAHQRRWIGSVASGQPDILSKALRTRCSETTWPGAGVTRPQKWPTWQQLSGGPFCLQARRPSRLPRRWRQRGLLRLRGCASAGVPGSLCPIKWAFPGVVVPEDTPRAALQV